MLSKLLFILTTMLFLSMTTTAMSAEGAPPTICHVKGITPDGNVIRIKGLPTQDNTQVFDIKMFKSSKYAQDIKAITKEGNFLPVKALGDKREGILISIKALNGEQLIDVKALTDDDKRLDVKAVEENNNSILGIKIVVSAGEYYPVKAICPNGHVFDIKAIRTEQTSKTAVYDIKAFEMNYSSGN